MSEKALKIVPPPAGKKSAEDESTSKKSGLVARIGRKRLRFLLLGIAPAMAVVIGLGVYLSGGRYVSTDNAYIGAQKVLVTPDISGKVERVTVREGQRVTAGDELFMLDPQPFRLALAQAKAKLEAARTDFNNLKTNLASLTRLSELAHRNAQLKQSDLDRKSRLLTTQATSQADVDTAAAAVVTAQLQEQYTTQQRANTLNQLLGDPELPLEKFPAYEQAKAAADQAQRDLDHTVLRAPISGTATQVDNIQLGRFVSAGAPIFSIIDDGAPWVEANPKETDITYLRVGQKAAIEVDSFPNRSFTGTVTAVSPGTGAQFSILPAQNATGNWVKVVQRVPVRIAFDPGQDVSLLRSGMSVSVEVDTKHSRVPFVRSGPGDTLAAK
ncbi:MAG: HlyD family secretion protein [Pseudolabrys sp.]|nr:HlyD family secretion protein [Pseudolabrys sp.]MBV9954415.1 HlyD family secretion protein [Pseudolabrys sp.]